MNTTYTAAIEAADFSSSTADVNHNRWTAGTLRHVIDALDGAPILLVDMNGFTRVGVTLSKIRETPGFGGHQVLVHDTYQTEAGPVTRGTWHSVSDLRMIVPLPTDRHDNARPSNVKHEAIRTHREESSAAVKHARPFFEAAGCVYGKYTTRAGFGYVDVTYEPQREDAGVKSTRRYLLAELGATLAATV